MVDVPLRKLASARSGDKGTGANIGVIARSAQAYMLLETYLTHQKVEELLQPLDTFGCKRYHLPNLKAFNFVLPNILQKGGSASLELDAQGKGLAERLLDCHLEIPQSVLGDADLELGPIEEWPARPY